MIAKLGFEKVFPHFKSSKSLLEYMRLLYNKTPTAITIFIYLSLFLFSKVKGVHYSVWLLYNKTPTAIIFIYLTFSLSTG